MSHVWDALVMAAAMAWQVGWSLAFGFIVSGVIQAVVSKEKMREQLGGQGLREIALATAYGAASSSCSYASAAIMKTLFRKGAGLIPSLAFLFASTNLVVELGIVLYLLMGWQFTAAEWIGGLVLVAIMSALVKLTYPARLVEAARTRPLAAADEHDHGMDAVKGPTLWAKLRNPQTRIIAAQNVAMDWSMLWKDLTGGFLIAGAMTAFVPSGVWQHLFLSQAPEGIRSVADSVVGPLIAVISFVCSIGNVPMAAILWGSGISFSGVLSFLYADLIVLPLLDAYRRYYRWRMAAYMAVILFSTMVIAGLLMHAAFAGLHLVPPPAHDIRARVETFGFNYTFWLNVVFAIVIGYIVYLNRRHPMMHDAVVPGDGVRS